MNPTGAIHPDTMTLAEAPTITVHHDVGMTVLLCPAGHTYRYWRQACAEVLGPWVEAHKDHRPEERK